mmetsp:Transcript_42530/g.83842  ORF Transcript_42530/g.83842 Transcript_42530/m.83842 type:complete len:295 (-) Transcript_42530:384-1268(-)
MPQTLPPPFFYSPFSPRTPSHVPFSFRHSLPHFTHGPSHLTSPRIFLLLLPFLCRTWGEAHQNHTTLPQQPNLCSPIEGIGHHQWRRAAQTRQSLVVPHPVKKQVQEPVRLCHQIIQICHPDLMDRFLHHFPGLFRLLKTQIRRHHHRRQIFGSQLPSGCLEVSRCVDCDDDPPVELYEGHARHRTLFGRLAEDDENRHAGKVLVARTHQTVKVLLILRGSLPPPCLGVRDGVADRVDQQTETINLALDQLMRGRHGQIAQLRECESLLCQIDRVGPFRDLLLNIQTFVIVWGG